MKIQNNFQKSNGLLRNRIIQLVFSLRPGWSLGQVIIAEKMKNKELNFLHDIDIVKLLGILQHKKIIERVREYPVMKVYF